VPVALAMFASHNIALMNSFYQEYALFLFLPVALLALMALDSAAGRIALMVAALVCGTAKLQFFYVPALVVAVLVYLRYAYRQRLDAGLLAALAAIQIVCVVPLARYSEFTAANRHHATFFGSYVVMTVAELDAAGVSPEGRACIGVDAWGNRLTDAHATDITGGHRSCVAKEALPLRRVLAPYVANPGLLFRLLQAVTPNHYASAYFHVSPANPYLRSSRTDGSYGLGSALIALSNARDAWFLHGGFLATALAGLALPFALRRRVAPGIAASALFLVAFAASQVVVCVLGEGLRDLGRHLSAAQHAMDLLAVICVVALVGAIRRSAQPSAAAPLPR
jgi:hypothetical protein